MGVIYPTNERNLVTTNDRMLFKKHSSFRTVRPQPTNHFEGSFKINQGKMSLVSSYDNDYKSYGDKARKPKYITREEVERPSKPDEHIPMFTETQTMSDYKYDPNNFRSVWVPKKVIEHL